MKITTLIENLVYDKGLYAEHGLSFYIDSGYTRIVFDTGQSGLFYENSRKMGIDIRKADFLVISHGHYDHTGGISVFLEKNSLAKILIKPEAFLPKYKNNKKIGIPVKCKVPLKRQGTLKDITEIAKNIYVFSKIKNYYKQDRHIRDFFTGPENNIEQDLFQDELFICIIKNNKLHILSSCSHLGITNIIETARRYFNLPVGSVIGGFHIKNAPDEPVNHILNYLNEIKVENIGVSHCTGIENYFILKNKSTANVFYNHTGNNFEI